MPKIQKRNKIEQCTKIFIYRDLKSRIVFEERERAYKRIFSTPNEQERSIKIP